MMSAYQPGNVLRRETLVTMLRAALISGDLRFARQAALSWLAAFPGDIEVTLLQAQAIIAEGRAGQTISALEMVCRKDPFSAHAYRVLAQACQGTHLARYSFAMTSLFVLDGRVPDQARLEPWGMSLRQAYLALESREYDEAEKCVQDALCYDPELLLAAVMHLLVDRARLDALTVQRLADIYHTRWPDCLLVRLVLAETYIEMGSEPEAVRLLHQCVANDTTGLVADRLWGAEHSYRTLWPEDPLIVFDLPVPAGVAGQLGWNRLPQGKLVPVEELIAPTTVVVEPSTRNNLETSSPAVDMPEATAPVDEALVDVAYFEPVGAVGDLANPTQETSTAGEEAVLFDESPTDDAVYEEDDFADGVTSGPLEPAPANDQAQLKRKAAQEQAQKTVQSVSSEFERLAKKLKQTDLVRADGRQPVYVIFTSREGLAEQYGPQTSAILNSEMRKLAELIRQRPGWDALVYYPDDAVCTGLFGLTPVNPRDPWKLKNSLADLDGALSKRGQMIGALLIVGGEPIVPFHRLPNPTDDADSEVASDSPYGTLGANYFVADWQVGRLPGEKGPDAGLLLEELRQIERFHARRKRSKGLFGLDVGALFRELFARVLPAPKAPSFGYTAAVWRRSSLAVFRPIGAPHTVRASPPENSSSVDRERIAAASLGYYNLHGLEDGPAWYGQRDPLEKGDDNVDYPVALEPADLHRNGRAPRVIFSEACYGGHVFGKNEGDSLALKFLSVGALAVVGSTCVAYGSVNTPLVAADLLGNLFWQHLKTGRTAGEALQQARVDLVREMDRRQGYLDGEDQKTLISFVLYGDPLATCEVFRARSKAIYRVKDLPSIKTVSDHADANGVPPQLTGEGLRHVKQIVAEYLPGADLSDLHLARQSAPIYGGTRPYKKSAPAGAVNGRVVVTVSKQVKIAEYVHHHYVRVTLDEGGKPVKLSISR
jgi:hypothetical protein